MRKVLFFLLAVAAVLPLHATAPKLVLAIAIDQMRYDYLDTYADRFESGFKTLLSKGAVFSNAHFRHANTETGPGHAVLMSGMHGSHSGIVANAWYDSFLKKQINVVDDPLVRVVGGKGRAASPANFIGFTIGDIIKVRSPKSVVVGVSLKDRSAILMAGKKADAAYWFEHGEAKFVTSTYYVPQAPAWLDSWNQVDGAKRYLTGEWKTNQFSHPLSTGSDLARTPFADEVTALFAMRAMEEHRIGTDLETDVLAVSFSATDYIGHVYGPGTPEHIEQLLKLDGVIGSLLKFIDERVGLANVLVMLSADHGVLPLVEDLKAQGLLAKRVRATDVSNLVKRALEKRFGTASLIAFSDGTSFWLDHALIAERGLKLNAVENEISRALMSSNAVSQIYRKSDFFKDAPAHDTQFALFKNSFFASRSPDIVGSPKKYYFISDYEGGTSHGTPHDYDRHVPIIFMGAGIKPGKYSRLCGPEDIAPTLARILSLDFPKETDSRVLDEMLADS